MADIHDILQDIDARMILVFDDVHNCSTKILKFFNMLISAPGVNIPGFVEAIADTFPSLRDRKDEIIQSQDVGQPEGENVPSAGNAQNAEAHERTS